MGNGSTAARLSRAPADLVTGVDDPQRLRAVVAAETRGHSEDAELQAVVETLHLACGVPMAVVNIVTPHGQSYPAEVGVGVARTHVPDGLSFCAEVVNTGRPLTVADAAHHPVYALNPMVLAGEVGAYAGVPLVENGVVLGSVALFDSRAREFSAADLDILRHQSELAGSVLSLRRQAGTDVLTGLPNRERLQRRLRTALSRLERHPGLVCVLYCDVDDFKGVNDRYGHAAGDGVLRELAHRLMTVLRPTDVVSRFGGDEFVAVCEELTSVDDVEALVGRVAQALGGQWVVAGERLTVHVSIGYSMTAVPNATTALLLHDADEAMYRAKQGSGNPPVVPGRPRATSPALRES